MTAAGADDSDSVFFLLEVVPVVFIVLGQGEEKLPRFTPIFCELLFDVIEDLFDVVEDLFVSTTTEAEEEEEEEEEVEEEDDDDDEYPLAVFLRKQLNCGAFATVVFPVHLLPVA